MKPHFKNYLQRKRETLALLITLIEDRQPHNINT